MNRRNFLYGSGALTSAAALGVLKPSEAAASDAPKAAFALASPPVVGHTTPDNTTITWAVNGPSTAWVEYGATPALGLSQVPTAAGLRPYEALVQQVHLAGLKPDTRYYYRSCSCAIDYNNAYDVERGETVKSSVGSFKTLHPTGETASFVIWNDTHDHQDTLTALHEQTSAIKPDFLFINGDISNQIASEKEAVDLYLNPYGLPFAQNYPMLFSRGNHDVRGAAARELPRFVAVPDNEFHYSFRHGPLGILVLDTGEDKPDSHPVYAGLNDFDGYRSVQQQWLEREIEKPHFRDAPFRVLFCHIPLWWKEDKEGWYCPDGRAKWHDLLVKAGIQLVVSGHTHEAAHLPPDDRHPYHQLIGGGPAIADATIIRGVADAKKFTITMQELTTGKALNTLEFKV